MTTPQEHLWKICDRTQKILQLLEGYSRDEDDESKNIFQSVKDIDNGMENLHNRMESIDDKMNLIIKLLSKSKGEK